MRDLIKLLSLYNKNPKKFDKEVKRATNKTLSATDVVNMVVDTINAIETDLESGALRPVRTQAEIFSVIKLGKYLIGKEVFRIWNCGKNGKVCSKVMVKGIVINEEAIYLETQAGYSAEAKDPVTRKLNFEDLDVTWFLTEKDCKIAISQL